MKRTALKPRKSYIKRGKILRIKKRCGLSISKLKAACWKTFSEFIRRFYANTEGFVSCVTCGISKHWKEMQAGHLIPGRGNSILFDERGIFPQCFGCNCMKHGNYYAFIDFIESKHGEKKAWEIIEDLKRLAKLPYKFTPEELQEMNQKYQAKIQQLENGRPQCV